MEQNALTHKLHGLANTESIEQKFTEWNYVSAEVMVL